MRKGSGRWGPVKACSWPAKPGELPVRFSPRAARLLLSRSTDKELHRQTGGQVSEARDLAEAHVRAFNERAWSLAADLYAPDLVVIEPGGTVRGIDRFVGHAQGFAAAFPDSRMEAAVIIDSGDRAVIEGVYTGTHTGPLATPQGEVPATGRTLQLPICMVFEVAAGRIASNHVYYDQMTFAAQLGLLPEPAPAN
jgi:steroid delta-isomerase-like uncharacterized protein